MTDSSSVQPHSVPSTETAWLDIPDLVEVLGLSHSRVRQLIEDKHLLAVRRDGKVSVPASFIRDGAPLGELRGTLIVLADDGFTDEQAMEWLIQVDDSLGVPPIDALLAGRKAEVRRVAQALA
ncbi:Rv2175c family DNA-binding protein [Cryobacterium sp. SO1]|uniref:Rv2175c family DNA-binding protein n=1 Tax=Cryobacterium sp. SO1 TaxID=1897061 RepID=UPI0010EC185D|nr:Rv2175c family DNA-binding protein [Cryobacterium sp. SO1]RZI34014.1 DNA-binding protein [Cryobacterium sp. SO1]